MVTFRLPFFPPTTNNAYYTRHGRRHLTDEGKAFKREVTSYLVQKYQRELLTFRRNTPYVVYLCFYFYKLENAGWPKKCSTRYKVFDVTNRVKLAEDALRDAMGVDDSQFIAVCIQKKEVLPGGTEYFEVKVWDMEKERSPLDGFYG